MPTLSRARSRATWQSHGSIARTPGPADRLPGSAQDDETVEVDLAVAEDEDPDRVCPDRTEVGRPQDLAEERRRALLADRAHPVAVEVDPGAAADAARRGDEGHVPGTDRQRR